MISLIVAMDPNGLIGKNTGLPWQIKEELAFFRKQTMNKFLLMGRLTYLALPNSLPGRKIIVLSKTTKNLGYKTIADFQYVLDRFANSDEEIYIAGGKSIYEKFYKQASTIYVSVVKKTYEGNVFLNWNLSSLKKSIYKEDKDFIVYKYTK